MGPALTLEQLARDDPRAACAVVRTFSESMPGPLGQRAGARQTAMRAAALVGIWPASRLPGCSAPGCMAARGIVVAAWLASGDVLTTALCVAHVGRLMPGPIVPVIVRGLAVGERAAFARAACRPASAGARDAIRVYPRLIAAGLMRATAQPTRLGRLVAACMAVAAWLAPPGAGTKKRGRRRGAPVCSPIRLA